MVHLRKSRESREERWAADTEVAALEAERQRREELAADRRERLGFFLAEPRVGTYADVERFRREQTQR